MKLWVAVFSLFAAVSCGRGSRERGASALGAAEAATEIAAEPAPTQETQSPSTAPKSPARKAEIVGTDLLKGVSVIERPGTQDPKESRPASAVAIPPAGRCINDPEFGTRICRVSDAVALGLKGAGIVPMYTGTPAWNSDESLLILYAPGGPGHQLFRGQPPYQYIGPLGIAVSEPEALYWDVNEPKRLRWVDKVGKRLLTTLVEPGSPKHDVQVVHDFTNICGPPSNKLPFLVETHHWQSFDGRYWGFKCDPGDGKKKLIAYDLKEDRILWILPYTGKSKQGIWGSPMPSPTGKFFVTLQDLLEVRDRDTGEVLRRIEPSTLAFQHMTMGIAERDGKRGDFYVTIYNEGSSGTNSALVVILLDTGRIIPAYLAEGSGYPYPPSGIHHSAISYRQPNYVWTSIIGAQDEGDPRQTDGQSLLGSEILVTNVLDGSVGRIAHHRSRRGMNPVFNANYKDYWQEPHISVSPSGCRAIFASDWSAGPQQKTPPQPKVDTFVVELPCFESRGR
jgi:hypothetical protein